MTRSKASAQSAQMYDYTAYHPMADGVQHDPYPYYGHLRSHEPVKHIPDLNGYAISRNAEVDHATGNGACFADLNFMTEQRQVVRGR